MSEHDAPRDWQNPWAWTVAALVVGVAAFALFTSQRPETDPLGWQLGAGRTGIAHGLPGGGSVPDELKGESSRFW